MGRMSRDQKRDKIVVRLDLSGYLKEKFDYLMTRYGASTYKGLIEMLITEKYEQMNQRTTQLAKD